MRTKLTLRRPQGVSSDIVVTTDVAATVGDVADALTRSEAAAGRHAGNPGAVTLHLESLDGTPGRSLRRAAGVAECGLRPGSSVSVVPSSERYVEPGVDLADAAARLTVLSGPDTGSEFALAAGVSTVGRRAGSTVRLTDRMVSSLHARVVVRDTVEIVDAGSANGVVVAGERVERATLAPSTVVLLGESLVQVQPLRAAVATSAGAVVPFNRSPRVVPRYPEQEVEAPAAPDPASPGRFPLLALVAPLLLGSVMYAVTQSTLSLVFVGLSPLLMIGTYLDKRLTDRRRLKLQTAQFRAGLTELEEDLASRHDAERAARLAEVPSTLEVVRAGLDLTPLLWARRPEHAEFLTVRLGTGRVEARTTVTLPARGRATPEHWSMLEEVRDRFATLDGAPVVVDLRTSGALGVAGGTEAADVARGLLAQLVCLHSPAELVVAGFASPSSAQRWSWVSWLPHVSSPHSPLTGHHLASTPGAAASLLTRLEEVVEARRVQGSRDPDLPALVVLVEDDTPADRGRLVRLAEDGPEHGLHVLWCASTVEHLPAVCRAFVAPQPDESPSRLSGTAATSGRVGLVQHGRWTDVTYEPVPSATAEALGRQLAAVVDAGAPVVDESDLPRSASYLALAGPEIADVAGAVVDRWHETGSVLDRSGATPVTRRLDASLRALVGQGADREFVLDLRSQGPHALVGGTTGAGKSEFLQAWVLGMAAAHSPDRVTFLFVDYKGGSAFADCVQLPHCVGLVTDLSPHLVRRALTSLRAELRHREQLLNRKKVKDLLALERSGDPETPPALVIVVDEFAALVSEVPEFVDGVVDVAQRGRSLGLHLILATQRPAGVIKDNLRANTNLRVALRMADEHDSVNVLGSPVAAEFDPAVPGRGAVRTGPGRIALFQTGYVGGRSTEAAPRAAVGIESLGFGPGEAWDVPAEDSPEASSDAGSPTDVARIVSTIRTAAQEVGIPAPRRPWLPELPTLCDLDRLDASDATDASLVLGVVDLPDRQAQRIITYRPDLEGSMVVYGTSGSGKSATLRTLAMSAGSVSGPVHVYGLDFGAGGLAMLAPLPYVGAVVDGSDTERVQRLLRTLRETIEERAARYAQAHAGSVTDYRARTGRSDEARILLLVDGLSAFREQYESAPGRALTWNAFTRVVAEGRPLGVHVVMTAERPGAMPTALAGSVARRLVLRQADEGAYGVLDVPKDVLGPTSPPGRGVLAGTADELQVAVAGGRSPAEQAAAVERLAAQLRTAGAPTAPPVRRLPSFVELSTLPDAVDGMPTLGLADDTLEPVGFEPHGTFLLAGLPGSGRTTVLTTLATSLRRFAPDARLCYVGNRRSPAHAAGVWSEAAVTPDEAAELARSLLPSLAEPPQDRLGVVLVVEAISDFLGGPAEQALTEAVKTARRNDHLVLAESETSTWGSAWPLVAEVRNGRRGLVLQPDHLDGDSLFRTPFPRMARAEFPPGRGVVVEHGRIRRIQIPVPE